MKAVLLPELGDGIKQATVSFWHCQLGDYVKEGDDIVELVTDKATFNVPAVVSGKVKEILIPVGKDVKIGDALAMIES